MDTQGPPLEQQICGEIELPIRKTAAPIKIARQTRPDLFAMHSMKKDNDPANSVPNPLLSPLHKVAPVIK